jgi:hypothetical protein
LTEDVEDDADEGAGQHPLAHEGAFTSLAALQAKFPPGTYALHLTRTGMGPVTLTVEVPALSDSDFPGHMETTLVEPSPGTALELHWPTVVGR